MKWLGIWVVGFFACQGILLSMILHDREKISALVSIELARSKIETMNSNDLKRLADIEDTIAFLYIETMATRDVYQENLNNLNSMCSFCFKDETSLPLSEFPEYPVFLTRETR
jgi:hypothetical protein